MVDENNQIRKMLNKVRLLKEDIANDQNFNFDDTNQETETGGEKMSFDDIQTIGFYTGEGLDQNIKDSVGKAVGDFIKSTGLILKTINVSAEDGRVVLTSDTVKNASTNGVNQITFDTNLESPELNIVGESLSLTDELVSLFQAIITSYNDPQTGRERLVSATQFNISNQL